MTEKQKPHTIKAKENARTLKAAQRQKDHGKRTGSGKHSPEGMKDLHQAAR